MLKRWQRHVALPTLATFAIALSAPTIAAAQASRHKTKKPVTPASAHAASNDEVAADPPKEAIEHYLVGRRLYLAGRYRAALVELKAALEYDHDAPDLLYNVARVYENLGELDEAIAHYRHYLERLPPGVDKDERERAQRTIRRLEGAQRAAEVARTRPPERGIGRADTMFWLTTGGAIVLFGAGAVAGTLALNRNADTASFVVRVDGGLQRRRQLADQADALALSADSLLVGGGVVLAAAALLFFLREPEQAHTPKSAWRLDLQLDDRRAVIVTRHHF